MKRYAIFVMTMAVIAGVLCAQQPAQKTSATFVTDPVFQTNGPYKVVEEVEPSLPTHTVYRPIDLAAVKEKLPILAWGNGGCFSAGNAFETYLTEISSYGFLIIANGSIKPEFPPEGRPISDGGRLKQPPDSVVMSAAGQRTTTNDIPQAIDWAIAQNSDPKSLYYGKIATDKIAVSGQSCGGLEALVAATDPRVTTAVIMNSGVFRGMPPAIPTQAPNGARSNYVMPGTEETLKKLHTPVIYLIGGEKDIAYKNSEADYQDIEGIPLVNANYDNVGHGGTLAQPFGGQFAQAARLWLQWQLKGDQEAGKAFLGPDCTLCQDPEWVVKKKNIK